MVNHRIVLLALACTASFVSRGSAQVDPATFVNWETSQVTPAAVTPDATRLLVVNTADGRLEVFGIDTATAVHLASIPVGLEPVSVRCRTNDEAWVVNHLSDSVSIVSLTTGHVVGTLSTDDEPADVVFAGTPSRAFVSCSQANTVLVYDPANPVAAPQRVAIPGEDPRALAVSLDGTQVYVAIFESGNGTTILGGGSTMAGGFPPNVVNHASGPYGGTNPPPNDGAAFFPPVNPANSPPTLPVGLIVRRNGVGQWLDDNGVDWASFVSGPSAALSGRTPGWQLLDHDVVAIDVATLGSSFVDGLMNLCMSVAVHPTTGLITVVGTEATNEVRFEPNLKGTFVRAEVAFATIGGAATVVDLNPHLDYSVATLPQSVRDLALGDPRSILWLANGAKAYVTGKGSNNVIAIDGTGARLGAPIEVGAGPTGLALDEARQRLYVVNQFDASVSVIDTSSDVEVARVAFYDPTPTAIREGRPFLYDTHRTSGLGQVACGSCHIDGRMDQIAWDLGDPSGTEKPFDQNCIDFNCEEWHPMKGPMVTQTLQDIIGKEPHHWRGDRSGIEEFNGAFEGLLGDDVQLTPTEMQQFEDFLATIVFPPNPYRNFDNTLPTSLPLPGHFTTGRFAAAGQPLPNGNAVTGLQRYRTAALDAPFRCVTCHTLPTGAGADLALQGLSLVPVPIGPNGEHHLFVNSLDGSTNVSMKVPQLRNLHEKVGMDLTQATSTRGFGYLHDGSVDSIARFVSEPVFSLTSVQDVANMVAFMLSFSGSSLPTGSLTNIFEPRGPASLDTPAAVGAQLTVTGANQFDAAVVARLQAMESLAAANGVGWVAKGVQGGLLRGYYYAGGGMFQSDRATETVLVEDLRLGAGVGSEVTFTVVPKGTEVRIGVDRDGDGFFDRDEVDVCADPADSSSFPPGPGCTVVAFVRGDCNADGGNDIADAVSLLGVLFGGGQTPSCLSACDVNDDGNLDVSDPIFQLAGLFGLGASPAAPFPGCGSDPTADALACGTFAPCP
ncbi:MAG: hypothetical protein AB7O52_12915 [Planctomycetota bacterium]